MNDATRSNRGGRILAALAAAGALAGVGGGEAAAQTFPGDAAWVPLRCGGGPMTDAFQDEPGALAERDLVGDDPGPTGWVALDAGFLYLRLRVEDDPAPGGTLRPFAWGVEMDLDGDLATYEILVLVDGLDGLVLLYENTVTTLPDDPNDPADDPPVAMYDFATNGQAGVAAGSSWGGTPDYFIDFALPWADLEALGLFSDTTVVVWAASSSNVNSLNGDFACHDGGSGDPTLSGTAAGPMVLDPAADTDGDGFADTVETAAGTDPNDPTSFPDSGAGGIILEGGGGCAVAGGGARDGAAFGALALAIALVALAWARRARLRGRPRVPRSLPGPG
ncbi:MAG TPA: thrombospondin type 3 repeat-containing protein [Myxococcota bacterium]|jgi:hypothetical protein|nr:thrombospondin type 3 repeat-containing protein [Myxococcota bacterium]